MKPERRAIGLAGRVGKATTWSFVSVAISTFTGVLSARTLFPEGRGHLALLISVTGVTVLISALGSNVAVRRLLPTDESVNAKGYWRLSHALLVLVVLAQASVYWILVAFSDLPQSAGTFAVMLSYGVTLFYSNQFVDLVYANALPVAATRLTAIGAGATFVGVAASSVAGLGLTAIGIAYAFGCTVKVVVARSLLKKKSKEEQTVPAGERKLLSSGSRLLGMTLGQVLASRTDTFLLGIMGAANQVGVYAVATSPAGLLRLPAATMGQVVMHDAAIGRVGIRELFRRMIPLMAVTVAMALVGYLLAEPIILMLFGPAYAQAPRVFQVLLIAEICLIPFLVLSRYIAARGSTVGASTAGLTGAVVLVLAAIFLIPRAGAQGAAWSSVTAYSAMSLVAIILSVISARHERTQRVQDGHDGK